MFPVLHARGDLCKQNIAILKIGISLSYLFVRLYLCAIYYSRVSIYRWHGHKSS